MKSNFKLIKKPETFIWATHRWDIFFGNVLIDFFWTRDSARNKLRALKEEEKRLNG